MAKKKRSVEAKAKPAKVRARALGHGVFATGNGDVDGRRGFELRNLPWIERTLGRPMVVAFIQSFNAAERLTAMAHLLELNAEAVDSGELVRERNARLLICLMLGTLYEGLEALRGLRQAGIAGVVGQDCIAWRRLDEIRRRWAQDRTLATVRHKLAHHLGDATDIEQGLKAFSSGRRLVLFQAEGPQRVASSTFPIGTEILMKGLDVDEARLTIAMRNALADERVFTYGVQILFFEVLRANGVRLSDEGANEDPLD